MARATRLDAPGSIHHVITRGIDRRTLFGDYRDRRIYCEILTRVFAQAETRVLAWALMPNHVHLLLQTGARPLSLPMQRLGTAYVRHFNKRHGRSGPLFDGRYKSYLIDDDAYLRTAVRYIHLNPVRGGIVSGLKELDRYPWTGHPALLGLLDDGLLAVDRTLSLFDSDPEAARARVLDWMARDASGGSAPALVAGAPMHRNAALVADSRSEETVLGGFAPDSSPRVAVRRARWSIDSVIHYVCSSLGARESAVRAGRRSAAESRARAAIAFLVHRQLGLPLTGLAPSLGVTNGALGRCLEKGSGVVEVGGLSLD